MLKISTWNICLGLKSKKNYVKEKILEEKIDICCIQECDIDANYPVNALSFSGYNIEVETNTKKARCCTYIKNDIIYIRRRDLEGEDNNLVILETGMHDKKFIVNLYRSFSPQNGVTPNERFTMQLECIKRMAQNNINHSIMLMGDFNLNYNLIHNNNYNYKLLFEKLIELTTELSLEQIVNSSTWSRSINGNIKESILDHFYIKDVTRVVNLSLLDPEIGDHKLIVCTINMNSINPPPTTVIKRCWKTYNKDKLNAGLATCDFDVDINDVQGFWNHIENELIGVIDVVAPLTEFTGNCTTRTHPSEKLKPKINRKRRLLKQFNLNSSPSVLAKLKEINKEIVAEIKKSKRSSIQRSIIPGNSKSLWNAIKRAKDINPNQLPREMRMDGNIVKSEDLSDCFANFFDNKVKRIVETCKVDNNVYNGKRKVTCNNGNFMTPDNIIKALKSIKIKNSEGYDRIPQRILNEGMNYLIQPCIKLFNLIYTQRKLPDQWSVSKIIPLFKKGSKTDVENYRPIANLCSMTKVYEQLIIDRLKEIETMNNCDLTGKSQHGFKKNRSTATAGLTIQSILTRALDQNKYALMASIDLSAAFDVVDVNLLLKRLTILGIPSDVIELINIWLKNRLFYIDIDGKCSYLKSSDTGTIQGSRLGPILYAIYVSPLFDLQKITNYADDNFIIRSSKILTELIEDMRKSLEAITKWLKQSGLKVNETKTELCAFHKSAEVRLEIVLNGAILKSKTSMNVLGVIFDSKLQWNDQIAHTVKKANSALHCIKLIKNYFTTEELRTIITSNFYSILYYNSEIWNIPNLNAVLKQKLLSISANALKICTPTYHDRMSFLELHNINNRATPIAMSNYVHALLLFKLLQNEIPMDDWVDLNFQQTFNNRTSTYNFVKTNHYKVGNNLICNRFTTLNGKIEYRWTLMSLDTYKIYCKNTFLKN